jgi:hypothetical protein
MGLLNKLAAPFKELVEWQQQRAAEAAERARMEAEQLRARREAYLRELMERYADAERVEPKKYRELTVGLAKTPALEYFRTTGEVHLYHLLPDDLMERTSVVEALGMRLDGLEAGEIGEIIDLKPKDMAPVEHGAVNLGPVREFMNADGTRWRFFIELAYSRAAGSFRGGIETRRFIVETTL